MPTPLCFILMPFGKKPDATGRLVDFDAVYHDLIAPAVRDAGLEPLRADEEMTGGIIHKPMFERLILCEYAVADLTAANANVFYELGVRHAVKPYTTVLLYAEGSGQLPFDVAPLRAIPYRLDAAGRPTDLDKARAALAERLRAAREPRHDSPLWQLLDGYPDIDHTRTDIFREQVEYAKGMKYKLAEARSRGKATVQRVEQAIAEQPGLAEAEQEQMRKTARKEAIAAVAAVETAIAEPADCEMGVMIDLFLSYRAVKGWQEMIALAAKMSPVLAQTVLVREQLGLALNRAGRGEEAERVLLELIAERGPSSETYGILGRVYKDRWETAVAAKQTALARGLLEKGIDAYLKGFEADWRDAYPGINAVTLMEVKEPPDPRRLGLLLLVKYAAKRRVENGAPDYWDYATLLEWAVLASDPDQATGWLGKALAAVREVWEPETTARNLKLIFSARDNRGLEIDWLGKIIAELEK